VAKKIGKKKISKKQKKKMLITVYTLFAIILLIYFGGFFYFKDKFLPNTYINDRDVSNQTVKEVEVEVGEEAKNYVLTIFDQSGGKEQIQGSEIGLVYDIGNAIKEIKKRQSAFLWIFNYIGTKDYSAKIDNTYDSARLNDKINELKVIVEQKDIAPVDARVELVNDRYEVLPEITGEALNKDAIRQQVVDAINTQKPELQLKDYIDVTEALITSDDQELAEEAAERNKIMDLKITYEFGSQVRELKGSTIKEWITVDDEGEVSVNRDLAYEYVLSLAKEFNTFGTDREFRTTDGRDITIKGGDYGWIINKEKETDALVKLIKEGKSETREPIYESKANSHDGIDTGKPSTYVEIDFTNQHLYYYLNGTLVVESDIVTGTKGTSPTREGTFSMMFKKTGYTLVGETWNRPVDYFIAFYTDVGLHDASWRGEFGGNIYTYNGSHGCVNMPRDKVEKIYNTIPEGTIFYCYY
jgi:hypothetical protein